MTEAWPRVAPSFFAVEASRGGHGFPRLGAALDVRVVRPSARAVVPVGRSLVPVLRRIVGIIAVEREHGGDPEAMMVEVVSVETVMPVEASMAGGPAGVTTAEARTACAARLARQSDCQYDRQRGDRDEGELSRTSKGVHVLTP